MNARHDAEIDRIDLYAVVVNEERRFSYGVQPNREHLFIAVSAGGEVGWCEANLGFNAKQLPMRDRIRRVRALRELEGQTVRQALLALRGQQGTWSKYSLELGEIALLDLAAKLSEQSSLSLLGLRETGSSARLHAVLDDRPEHVRKQVKVGQAHGLNTHCKVKLYGDLDTDLAVIKTARQAIGPDAMLMGDANFGYRREVDANAAVGDIVTVVSRLHKAGLDAFEDPANLTTAQWCSLQRAVGKLNLLPDVMMRPAWEAAPKLSPAMSRGFNTHPGTMGSVIEVCALAQLFKQWNKIHMIGDASLVGPGCAAWSQLAIGLDADWVEATEKPWADQVWLQARSKQTVTNSNARVAVDKPAPGWGEACDPQALLDRGAQRFEL